jgi:hypothetical protein
MIKKIKIELIYFCAILLILAALQHSDLLYSPMARITLMAEKENYFHPLLWTSVVYVVVGFFRLVVKLFRKIRG